MLIVPMIINSVLMAASFFLPVSLSIKLISFILYFIVAFALIAAFISCWHFGYSWKPSIIIYILMIAIPLAAFCITYFSQNRSSIFILIASAIISIVGLNDGFKRCEN